MNPIETLVTLPRGMADYLNGRGAAWKERLAWPRGSKVFATSDPGERKLGSGGGTVNALFQAWQASGEPDFDRWLAASKKIMLHAGGESRRLPAYAAPGKIFLPLPHFTGLHAQRFDQILADFQMPAFSQALAETGTQSRVLVASGDVWLDFNPLEIPVVHADICGIGMRVTAERAQHFGVFFVRPGGSGGEREIAAFLQKPRPQEIHARQPLDFFVDTGMWLLSAHAVKRLFADCGWDGKKFATSDGLPKFLDLYTETGALLGRPEAGFTASVVPLENASFHHVGSSRQLFETVYAIGPDSSRKRFLTATAAAACIGETRRPIWCDTVLAAAPIHPLGANLLTHLPPASRLREVPEHICVDAPPVDGEAFCLRVYHLDDTLRAPGTICGRDAASWLKARGFPADTDLFHAKIHPVLRAEEITQEWLDWFLAEKPVKKSAHEFLSAAEIAGRVNLERLFDMRRTGHAMAMGELFRSFLAEPSSAALDQDFRALLEFIRSGAPDLAPWLAENAAAISQRLFRVEHRTRFAVFLSQLTGSDESSEAFGLLRDTIIASRPAPRESLRFALKSDQIVWARSPVRIDLAGGWTDTPPLCFERGGSVLNVAVTLNGQPPVQTFIRNIPEPVLKFRSIDLGSAETVATYEELNTFRRPDASFAIPKAALALAGFHPEFAHGRAFDSLCGQLEASGSGLELTLLCAVPKGSGLGSSSILAATVFGALSRACGLGWDTIDIYRAVLALEQLLTTGGGWQDQAGALFPGAKLIETAPGLGQTPSVRFVPERAFDTRRNWLLYYTGVTRLAKNILAEIVTDMFLGRFETRVTLDFIRLNAREVYDALQTDDARRLARGVARSWQFNNQLDSGTTTPEIDRILALCGDDLAAAKLPGAGGGGYLLIGAKDADAAARIRARLESHPVNPRARFVDFAVSNTGLEVTVS